MKNHLLLFAIISLFFSCTTQEIPTKFSEKALNDTFITLNGEREAFKEILKKHHEKIIIIDLWATWCADCIKGIPKVKKLKEEFPDAVYVFLSLDKNQQAWKKGVKDYTIKGEHYFIQSGWKSPFVKFVNLYSIPRYMVLDKEGNIKLFKATKADDKRIKEFLINN